jgi:hypothetical protein
MTTPIENRAMWKIHHATMAKARAQGADFACATELGFAATDAAGGKAREVKLCERCIRRGVAAERKP